MKRTALITGGSRGIGLGIARALAASQFDLAINGVRPESAVTDVINELKSLGSDVIYCQGNLASSADRRQMLQKVQSHLV